MDPSSILDVVAQGQTEKSASDEEHQLEPYPTDPWADLSPTKGLGVLFGAAAGLLGIMWLISRKRQPMSVAYQPTTPSVAPVEPPPPESTGG